MSGTAATMAQTAETAAQNCKLNTPPLQNESDIMKQAAPLLNSLGLNQCKTTTTSKPETIGVNVSSQSGLLSSDSQITAITGTALSTYTVGCQSVNVVAQAYVKAVQDVKCIIQNSDTTSSIETIFGAKIKLTFGKNSHTVMNCPQGVNIENTISGSTTIYNHIHQATKTQITDAIISHITPAIQALQAQSPKGGPKGQGSQSFNAVISQLSSGTLAQQISTSIDNACTTTKEEDVIDIKFDGWMYMDTLEQCNFTNDIHANIIAISAVQTAFQGAFQNQNLPSLLPPPPEPSAPSHMALYIIIAVIVVLLVFGGGYYYFFVYDKKKTAATKKAFQFKMCSY